MLKPIKRPPTLLRWLMGATTPQWFGASHLPESGAILVVTDGLHHLAEALMSNNAQLRLVANNYSALSVPSDPVPAITAIRTALESGRKAAIPVVPLGIAASPTFSLLGVEQVPLPRAHIVACVEVPFIVPQRPDIIAEEWIKAVQQQLRQANGRALDHLSTLRRASNA
jgi:hypothetical protein